MGSVKLASQPETPATDVQATPGSDEPAAIATAGSTSVSVTSPVVDANINDLMSLSSGDTHSSVTPLGVHFEYAATLVPSASDQTLLNDAHTQPSIVPSTSGQTWQPFQVILYPHDVPIPADVNQHAIGDCDGDSALASLAYQHPKFIMSLIQDNGDATFGVAMYDPTGAAMVVNVDSMFMADSGGDIGQVSGKDGVADWATVLEKAVIKYASVYGTSGGAHNGLNTDIGGIGSEYLLPMLTGDGNSFSFAAGSLTPMQLQRAVSVSLQNGMEITGGFNEDGYTVGQDATVTSHGYDVMLPEDANDMVTMRNPWGVEPWSSQSENSGYDVTDDGLLNIPATQTFSNMVDLRVISGGSAGSTGRTTPYTPPDGDLSPSAESRVVITEHHAVR